MEKLKLTLGEEVDERPERFNFTWAGKNKAIKTVLTQSKATLKPAKDESIKFDESENLIIEGDNLEVLKLLQKTYFEKVKMIYIDPPYNTGGDFVYHDDFSAPINSYLKQTGQLDEEGNKQSTNKETNGRYHSDWLSMMYPRLKLAWNLLKNSGVIFVSIDDNEAHNLRKVMDEVFGEENFIAQIIWERAFSPKNDSKYFSENHDYILVYAKQSQDFRLNKLARTDEANARYKNIDNDPRGLWISDNLTAKTYSQKYDYPITTPSGKIISPSHGSCWRVSQEKLKQLIEDNRIWFGDDGTNVPRLKRFLSEVQDGMVTTTIWKYKDVGHNQEGRQLLKEIFDGKGYFDGPKPVRLIKRILELSTTKDDIILDFFAGSGTTAQAVLELGDNRKFILVQLPEKTSNESEAYKEGYKTITDITKERIRRVINGYGTSPKPIDSGFKVFKLAPSNYPEVSYEFDPERTEEENQKSLLDYLAKAKQISLLDKSINPIDIVYENIVKEGFSLNSKVTEGKVDGNHIFIVEDGENEMRISLDEKISQETVKKLSELEFKGKTFVCYDNALSDSDKANIGLNLELKTI